MRSERYAKVNSERYACVANATQKCVANATHETSRAKETEIVAEELEESQDYIHEIAGS